MWVIQGWWSSSLCCSPGILVDKAGSVLPHRQSFSAWRKHFHLWADNETGMREDEFLFRGMSAGGVLNHDIKETGGKAYWSGLHKTGLVGQGGVSEGSCDDVKRKSGFGLVSKKLSVSRVIGKSSLLDGNCQSSASDAAVRRRKERISSSSFSSSGNDSFDDNFSGSGSDSDVSQKPRGGRKNVKPMDSLAEVLKHLKIQKEVAHPLPI